MVNQENTVHLALAFDENYITPFYVLLTSLFINNKNANIVIHVIVSGITEDDKNSIVSYVQSNNAKIHFYTIDLDYVSKLVVPEKDENPLTGAMYYRLFFPFLVAPEISRLLYIDVDTLVVGNLSEVTTLDLCGKPVGAVTDTDMPVRSDLGIDSLEDYFNSGVLLIDIAKWKRDKISETALKIISEEPDRIKSYPDQDALNMALRNNWHKLERKFNLMRLYVPNEVPKRKFTSFLHQQKIIHYNGKKPWFSDCEHRLRFVYQQYARLSPRVGASSITNVKLSAERRNALRRSRLIEFYFDHPEVMAVWRKLKALVK